MLVEEWRRARTHERREKKQKDPILRELWDSGFFPRSFLQIWVRMMQRIECIVKLKLKPSGQARIMATALPQSWVSRRR